ncbi:membrane-spanning 4-domains subfamily A member 7 [Rousettus aegyptiacus]|uniref:membrane-spanning 4-domains subfamily A member 7 n=1 Tax=Rousettus aegyptiacus TaxID=9407 RepID=UPI00168D4FE8|nr:membrane-spanning 4-domains subfamily A member 7 [Rousettus aegyptiacus]
MEAGDGERKGTRKKYHSGSEASQSEKGTGSLRGWRAEQRDHSGRNGQLAVLAESSSEGSWPSSHTRLGCRNSVIGITLTQPKAEEEASDRSTPKGTVMPQREKLGHIYQKEDKLQDELQKEATVLGVIQILCGLMISSLGAIMVFAPYSSHFNPAVSTILMSGYPFVGALCFAITGCLSVISGKKSTKPFAVSSLTSNAVSSVAAGASLFLLAHSLVALRTASQLCDSEKEHLSSLPYSEYYYSVYDVTNCRQAGVSLTGVLVVMLAFTVLELLLAVYASVFWWKQVQPNASGSAFSLLKSQDHIQYVKKSSSGS